MIELTPAEARDYLVGHHGLRAVEGHGASGVRAVLGRLRCIQLDPLDPIGTNADLVALARVDGIRRGDVYEHTLGEHGFEHYAKERCILPATAFPYYRERARRYPNWRLTRRLERIPDAVLDAVLDELHHSGPATPDALTDHGRVEALDWSGWKGTSKATTMALEVLFARCRAVVCGRTARGKRYDVPARALPGHHDADADGTFEEWALLERVEAAGLLSTATGPQWGMLGDVRTTLPDRLVDQGRLERVTVRGSRRTYLAPRGFRDRVWPDDDGRMRILGPLDPLLWDRKLVQHAFGFEYIWEVYKPASTRRWGWYVMPLLHRGQLVGRIEAHVEGGEVVVDRLWREEGVAFDSRSFDDAIRRHSAAL